MVCTTVHTVWYTAMAMARYEETKRGLEPLIPWAKMVYTTVYNVWYTCMAMARYEEPMRGLSHWAVEPWRRATQCVWYAYATYQHIATYVHYNCNILATYLQPTCNILTTCAQPMCNLLASYLQHNCNTLSDSGAAWAEGGWPPPLCASQTCIPSWLVCVIIAQWPW